MWVGRLPRLLRPCPHRLPATPLSEWPCHFAPLMRLAAHTGGVGPLCSLPTLSPAPTLAHTRAVGARRVSRVSRFSRHRCACMNILMQMCEQSQRVGQLQSRADVKQQDAACMHAPRRDGDGSSAGGRLRRACCTGHGAA